MNNEWRTGAPETDGIYLVASYDLETGYFFRSLATLLNGKWLNEERYKIVGWLPLPDLPEAPKDVPQVEKITWYPFAIWPEKQGTYLVKGTAPDGVTIYDKLFYDGARWPENDYTFWAKQN